jgi:hypothetical protein
MITRQDVLTHIVDNLADVAGEVGVATTDDPKTFKYVIDEVLQWAGINSEVVGGLTNYFAYRLLYARLVTNGLPVSSKILATMRGTEQWCANAGFDFSGEDNG